MTKSSSKISKEKTSCENMENVGLIGFFLYKRIRHFFRWYI